MANSSVALATAILVGIAIFGLGYVFRSFQSARGNLRGAKSSVPTMRKTYWSSLWGLVKWGVVAVAIVVGLVTWTAHSSQADDAKPAPSPSVSRR